MKYIVTGVRLIFLSLFLFLIINGKMMMWLGLFAISLIAALFFGRVYCGYACPMNTLMGITEWISRKLNLQRPNTPKWLRLRVLSSGKFSWMALVLSVAAMLISKRFLSINIPILLIWLAISLVVTLRYKPEVFHNLICPFGALQRTFGKFAFFSKMVNEEKCVGCKLCEKACPSDAIKVDNKNKKAHINTALCLQCSNCQAVCPKDAIAYSSQKQV